MKNTLAVLDLGSNSFHMLVAEVDEHQNIQVIDKIKDNVRLAGGLNEEKHLDKETQKRALNHFSQYSERLRGIPESCIRVVATDTFRRVKNGSDFLQAAQIALDHPIEIISGLEEARLIHTGVSHDFPTSKRRLIIDIGGGSTELIIGEKNQPLQLASIKMGCVSWTKKYFSKGFNQQSFKDGIEAAQREMESRIRRYRELGWVTVVGTSGTIKAISEIGLDNFSTDGNIRLDLLEDILRSIQSSDNWDSLKWDTLSKSRQGVLAGGLCILVALFKSLKIRKMTWVPSALREGVLIEMIGRMAGEDIRDKSVKALEQRFQVDRHQSKRVRLTLNQFISDVQEPWRLNTDDTQLLNWSATLHEIGRTFAFSSYHKHSAYIVKNADLAGFSRTDQGLLSVLIRKHRGKIRPAEFSDWIPELNHHNRLIALLRIAVRLNRRRDPKRTCEFHIQVDEDSIYLVSPIGYLDDHPLTRADLEIERTHLSYLGIDLDF